MPLIRRGNSKGLRLNGNHPAASGARFLAVANGSGTMLDIITGQRGTPSGTVVQQNDGLIGTVVNLNTATTTDVEFAGRSTSSYSEITVAAIVKFTAIGSVAQQVIFSDNVPATSGFSLSINAANFPQFTCNAANVGTTTAVVAGGTYFIAATRSFNASGTIQDAGIIVRRLDATAMFLNATTATITGPASGGGTISISRKNATAYHHGDVAFVFMSTKGMPFSALRAWAIDPWSIFGRNNDIAAFSSKFVNPGAVAWTEAKDIWAIAGGITGSGALAWTEKQDTWAISGAVAVSGSAAWTESKDVWAVAGGITGTATVAWTESPDIWAISGTVGSFVSGTAAWTETKDIWAVSGAVAVSGLAAWTESRDIWAVSGTVTLPAVTGLAAWTETPDTWGIIAANGAADTHDYPFPWPHGNPKEVKERERIARLKREEAIEEKRLDASKLAEEIREKILGKPAQKQPKPEPVMAFDEDDDDEVIEMLLLS